MNFFFRLIFAYFEYQRLEYLGDAVLDYLVTSYLYTTYPELKRGQLTDLRSMSVCNLSFADVAIRLSIHKYVICDSSDLRESMSKYANEIGNSASQKHIEERACPKVIFLHLLCNLIYFLLYDKIMFLVELDRDYYISLNKIYEPGPNKLKLVVFL